MNSRETNEKILKNLQDINLIPAEEQKQSKIEEVTEELPFAFARKICAMLSIAVWAFGIVAMLTGFAEMRFMLSMMLLPIGALALFNAPVFFKKKKIFDMIIAIAAGAVCVFVAVVVLFFGEGRMVQ